MKWTRATACALASAAVLSLVVTTSSAPGAGGATAENPGLSHSEPSPEAAGVSPAALLQNAQRDYWSAQGKLEYTVEKTHPSPERISRLQATYASARVAYGRALYAYGLSRRPVVTVDDVAAVKAWNIAAKAALAGSPTSPTLLADVKRSAAAVALAVKAPRQAVVAIAATTDPAASPSPAAYNPRFAGKLVLPTMKVDAAWCMVSTSITDDDLMIYKLFIRAIAKGGVYNRTERPWMVRNAGQPDAIGLLEYAVPLLSMQGPTRVRSEILFGEAFEPYSKTGWETGRRQVEVGNDLRYHAVLEVSCPAPNSPIGTDLRSVPTIVTHGSKVS